MLRVVDRDIAPSQHFESITLDDDRRVFVDANPK